MDDEDDNPLSLAAAAMLECDGYGSAAVFSPPKQPQETPLEFPGSPRAENGAASVFGAGVRAGPLPPAPSGMDARIFCCTVGKRPSVGNCYVHSVAEVRACAQLFEPFVKPLSGS